MFFNKIRRMRKNIKDKKWLECKLNELIDFSEWLHDFYDFKCKVAFVGEIKAEHNSKWYYINYAKNVKRIAFIKRMLKAT